MKKKIFIAAAVFFSGQLHAQQPVAGIAGDSTIMDEVVVTATKTAIRQSQTGKVISVITKAELEKKGGRTLSQVLNEQAGIVINGALNSPGNPQTIFTRGGSAGRTLVLMDGIPVYDPSLINSEFDLNLLLVSDIERIEICRGAQSTLYGSDAVAGVINIITVKKEVSKAFNAKATVTAGSFNTFRTNAQVYGKAGKLTYSSRFANLSTKGFSSAYDSTGKANFDKDGYNGTLLNAALQYQLANNFAVNGFIQNSNYKNDIDAGVFRDEDDYNIKNTSLMTGAGFVFKNDNVSLTGNYQYSEGTRKYFNDSTDKPSFTTFSKDEYFSKTQFVELFASINLSKNFSLLQGADYRYGSMNNTYQSLSSFGPFNSFFKDTSVSQASLYASVFYKSDNTRLNIELGGRLNVHSRYGSNQTFTFNPSYALNKNVRVFGSVATAFKAPSLFQLYSSSGNKDLKPEESVNYETGMEVRTNKMNNRLVFFYREVDNGLDFDYNTFTYFNFLQQIVRGLEVESSVKPTDRLSLTANYTYISPTEKTQSRKTFSDTTYNNLLRRAKHNLNATVGYQVCKPAFISLTAKAVSKRFDVGGFMANDAQLDSYVILGAYGEYKLNKYFKAFVDAQNITDKEFFDVRGYNSIPFTLNAGVTFNW